MESKKHLKNICLECEEEMGKNYVRCPFRSISNEYCYDYITIEKDLERLEIYEKFTIPNLRKLILKLYNNEELTREENEIIFDIMSLKNEALEDD